jgi:hypothetical protein
LTSSQALNWTTIEDRELREFDDIVSIHLTFQISFSSFFVTRSSMVSGLAQGIVTTTDHIPRTTSG